MRPNSPHSQLKHNYSSVKFAHTELNVGVVVTPNTYLTIHLLPSQFCLSVSKISCEHLGEFNEVLMYVITG